MCKLLFNIALFALFFGTAIGFPIFFPVISRSIITSQANDDYKICNSIVLQSGQHITNNTLKKTAVSIMENTCMNMPKKMKKNCIRIISKNFERIIRMILKKEDASIICSEMHVCSIQQENVTDCKFCKYASVRIEGYLKKNHTLTDIISFAEHFCEDISDNYYNTCTYLMDIHYIEIVLKLLDKHNAISACEEIDICSKNDL